MTKFYNWLNEGRSRGKAMEEVIVSAVNGTPTPDEKYGIPAEAIRSWY